MADISNAYKQDAGTDFSLGDVFGLSSSILGANFPQFAALGAIASLPLLAILILFPETATGDAGGGQPVTPLLAVVALLSVILIFPMMIVAQAMILFGAFQDMLGRPVRILPSIGVGLARILPIIGLSVVQAAGVLLGFALFVIPGIIVALAWSVALPVCVVEKLGPIASLRRSAALTKGHRWKLLGISVSLAFAGALIGGAINGNLAYGAILSVVIYRDLRVTKEGVTTEHIAAVFD
jgi:uncharacterized membrane protein